MYICLSTAKFAKASRKSRKDQWQSHTSRKESVSESEKSEMTDDVETDIEKDDESDWGPAWSDVKTSDLDFTTDDDHEEKKTITKPLRQKVINLATLQ